MHEGVVQCGTAAAPIALDKCTPFNIFNLNDPNTLATPCAQRLAGSRSGHLRSEKM